MKAIVYGLTAIMLAGCMTSPYPESWQQPQTDSKDRCRSLAGSYEPYGAQTTDETGKAFVVSSLSDYLITNDLAGCSSSRAGLVSPDRIELVVPEDGTLRVSSYVGSRQLAVTTYSEQKNTLKCLPSGAEIRLSKLGGCEEVLIYANRTLTLQRAADGSLLVKKRDAGVGFYGTIPIPGGDLTSWSRFHAIEPK